MRLQTDLSVILYYSNLTPNREKCQAAERKHILKKKKNHINNNKKIILALKYSVSILICFFCYQFQKLVFVLTVLLPLVPTHSRPHTIRARLKESTYV